MTVGRAGGGGRSELIESDGEGEEEVDEKDCDCVSFCRAATIAPNAESALKKSEIKMRNAIEGSTKEEQH